MLWGLLELKTEETAGGYTKAQHEELHNVYVLSSISMVKIGRACVLQGREEKCFQRFCWRS
jgi:hypothetical protein